ncbi:armadillo-type protein [Cadophora sp. MPI-SDFR-AT-0126]|nr:armadillo-type protein [Leotiomycetes sp. MPI-SDFR-AT-0126]
MQISDSSDCMMLMQSFRQYNWDLAAVERKILESTCETSLFAIEVSFTSTPEPLDQPSRTQPSLTRILNYLELLLQEVLQEEYMHIAGNDAHFVLTGLLMLVAFCRMEVDEKERGAIEHQENSKRTSTKLLSFTARKDFVVHYASLYTRGTGKIYPAMAPSATSPPPTSDPTILALRKTLCSETEPLARRFRALFSLKHLASQSSLPAIQAIAAAFASPSALLKHELAYCLGQTKDLAAVPYLRTVLEDKDEDPMCRHEAAEALGAIGDMGSLDLLRELRDRPEELVVVKETCEIAVARIEWENSEERKREKLQKRFVHFMPLDIISRLIQMSDFASIDPAPTSEQTESIEDLEKTLLDTTKPLFLRYRAMFGLRDLASPPDLPTAVPAVLALAKGFADPSALFRHEIAFVFGQLSHPASIPALTAALGDLQEESMVRHEAAEALGSLGEEDGVEETLKRFLNDKEHVVRESVIVALDMAEFEKAGEVEYALIPETANA